MQQVRFRFSNGLDLTYELNNTRTTLLWCDMLAQMQPHYLMRSNVNHRHGFATDAQIADALVRLRKCADALGFELGSVEPSNWHSALNTLHVNFPNFFTDNFDPSKAQTAHSMNLLIHWLEYELGNTYDNKAQYIFNLDFNHYPPAYNLKTDIVPNELGNFSPYLEFGNLHLHYIYIGRHFLEMFDAQDTVSPSSHFRAQHEFNATCGLVFSEPVDRLQLDIAMQKYYTQKHGSAFFGFPYDSLQLAKGFFKLGKLLGLSNYQSLLDRQQLRRNLATAAIQSWHFL